MCLRDRVPRRAERSALLNLVFLTDALCCTLPGPSLNNYRFFDSSQGMQEAKSLNKNCHYSHNPTLAHLNSEHLNVDQNAFCYQASSEEKQEEEREGEEELEILLV